ncbi:cadmium resistance transporter [Actinoalloteichus caeruleus]|uniref:Cadmium resistance protein CadD, predicted permease n=1 Tax=Actinoalloteichus caeruleus DSM 43889 TaxID=1120930 RepID=A0ABT1JPV5_ACTCY|nr:cadmium resistance transporter [Actinoalloteichus caeruleus]MCP2334570.1 Cadmium resistance protein CadD, predicted permease [Actinoalloteichus caeruleus DSM 43889]
MNLGLVGQAVGLFVVTNIDDIVVIALFFAQGAGRSGTTRTILLGQYLGFCGILIVSVAAALGATFLPDQAVPYLGLLPLLLGVRAAVEVWLHRDDSEEERATARTGPTVVAVTAVTFANGGDNIGVYVPVFATAGVGGTSVHIVVSLVLLALLVLTGRHLATRPTVARALARWGHILMPVVLIAVGLVILVEGGAFGL